MSIVLRFAAGRIKGILLVVLATVATMSIWANPALAAVEQVFISGESGIITFEPATITIKAGDSVKWINALTDDPFCGVIFENAEFNEPRPSIIEKDEIAQEVYNYLSHRESLVLSDESFQRTFNTPEGVYSYVCTGQEDVAGKIIVRN